VNALAISNIDGVKLSLTTEFHLLKTQALEKAKSVAPVVSTETMQAADSVLSEIKGILKKLETSRNTVKSPVLDLGRKIDGVAKDAAKELEMEKVRLDTEIKAYYREQERKAEAARQFAEKLASAKREKEEAEARAAESERRRLEAEAANAKSQDEAARLRAEAAKREQEAAEATQRAEAVEAKPIAAPVKSSNMTVRKVWKHEVIDIAALYKVRPELVTLEPKTNEINKAIREGGMRECQGLRIFEETDTIIRS
jgi:chromosome segregation ATPase